MSFEIARAGWMQRQSSVLHRWKQCWLVLYQSGEIRFFEKPDHPVAEEVANMPRECLHIRTGAQMAGVNAPDNHSRSCLIQIEFKTKKWNLCAESHDDMSAWKIALEQARVTEHHYPGQTTQTTTTSTTVVYPNQQTVVYPANPTNVVHYPGGQTVTYVNGAQTAAGGQTVTYINGAPAPAYGYPGQTTVVYTNQPYRCRRGYRSSDVALGAVAGVAVGSMLMGPVLFW